MSAPAPAATVTALILAGSRSGAADAVALLQQRSHKCLVEVDGVTMIERAVQVLIDSGCCRRILVSIEDEAVLAGVPRCRSWLDDGAIEVVPSRSNLADSVLTVAQLQGPLQPLLITTADSVLHTPELIRGFVASSLAAQANLTIGFTRESTVRQGYPDAELGFFRFREGGYSFCNLFVVRTDAALQAARVFRGGGQFRKRPWRIVQAFGLWNLICYRQGWRTLDRTFERLSHQLGCKLQGIEVTYSFAPLDVDNSRTFALAEETLRNRRLGQAVQG